MFRKFADQLVEEVAGLMASPVGGWTVPFIMVLAVYAVQITLGVLAGRNRYV